MSGIMPLLSLLVLAVAPPIEPIHQGRSLSAWIADLDSGDEAKVARAVGALAALGPAARPALPGLVELAFSTARDKHLVRHLAVVAVRRVGLPRVEEIASQLAQEQLSGYTPRRRHLLRLLYLHGAAAAPASSLLLEELKCRPGCVVTTQKKFTPEQEAEARERRILIAGTFSQIGPVAMPVLVEAGAWAVQHAQRAGLTLLADLVGLYRDRAVPGLIEALDSGRPWDQRFAAVALERLGANGAGAVSALRRLEKGTDEGLVRIVREAREEIEERVFPIRVTGVLGVATSGQLPAVLASVVVPDRAPQRSYQPYRPVASLPSPAAGTTDGLPLGKVVLVSMGAGVILLGAVLIRLLCRRGPTSPDVSA